MAKIKPGEPILVLGSVEKKILSRLLTPTYNVYEKVAGLTRLFTRATFEPGEQGYKEWTYKELASAELPVSAMKAHIAYMRRELKKAEKVLDELAEAIK